MTIFEWSSYEIILLMAGYLSIAMAGACVIILNCLYIFFVIPLAGSVASMACIGKCMGEGDH